MDGQIHMDILLLTINQEPGVTLWIGGDAITVSRITELIYFRI